MGGLVQRNQAEELHFAGDHALGSGPTRALRLCLCFCLLVTLTSLPGEVSAEPDRSAKKMAQEVGSSLVLQTPRLKLSYGAALGWVGVPDGQGCFASHEVIDYSKGLVWYRSVCLAHRTGERRSSVGGFSLFRPADRHALSMIDTSLFSLEWEGAARETKPKVPSAKSIAESQSDRLYSLGCWPGNIVTQVDATGQAVFYALCHA